ncbi:arginine--tRNA ligase [Flavobacteriaceae bacterium F08102]|nr:arginine--tRNA ligase [Flavobacteriaceae bacterium F08102]
MQFKSQLEKTTSEAIRELYNQEITQLEFQATRKDFEGDITLVIFPLLRTIKGNPVVIGEAIGAYLAEHLVEISAYNVVKGFLNLSFSDQHFLNEFYAIFKQKKYGFVKAEKGCDAVMVEYSSPNTNKPLHLGHIRNNILGYSVANITAAAGKKVYKTQIINDRGIHICKSMLAWQRFGNGETPASTGLKGDKLVGNYYVKFDQEYKKEIANLIAQGYDEKDAKAKAPILFDAQKMLQDWEAGDPETVALWEKMNAWVYAGFEKTYADLGVDFDINYYESKTYLLGKNIVEEGLSKGVFFKKDDGSVWIDLSDEGLDEKIVLRADGTSVYITQDIGTAIQRVKDFPDVNSIIYTVGNEQDYHFKVLFLILKKLGYAWADHLYHLSYGMVELPSGKMKSREGTVVDADDLLVEMTETARSIAEELGKLEGYSAAQKNELYRVIGLGALKYHILKVDPKKAIMFDPESSIEFNGNTGPFIQYTYARIQSVLRKSKFDIASESVEIQLDPKEKSVLKQLNQFPSTIQLAAEQHSPAIIANYLYELVKEYNSFYQSVPIIATENAKEKTFRLQLSYKVAEVISSACELLGIEVPERM